MLTVSSAWGFVIGGPIGNGGDKWQVPTIGYGLGGDLLAPKNIGEEYRRVTPVMYYAYDANFFGFFGLAGATNIDAAFGVMNSLTNVSTYSPDLSEFPLASQQFNYRAQSLELLDLKSVALGLLAEQMGLGEPERYAWTLHDRYQPPGTTCPFATEYLVVQRNFDYFSSPLNQIQYSPYVNGTLYSYQIFEFCKGTPTAFASPYNVDPSASLYTPVASFNLGLGGYYTTLTRDDVAGLRYLLSSNNVNYEATSPSGGLLLQTNQLAPQLLTTLPISLLLAQSVTNSPSDLQSNYPGLTFVSVRTNIVVQVTPTITAYYTNLPPPYTNTVPLSNGVSIYSVGGTVPFPAWSPVQYGAYPNFPVLMTTLPLGPLLRLSPYLDPVTLQALYPGLLTGPVTTNFYTTLIATNPAPYFTNQSVPPVFTNFVKNGLTNGYYFTNQPGPTTINFDTTIGFQVIQTLDLANFGDLSRTNPPAVMQALYPGLEILRATTSPAFVGVTNYVNYLTNQTGSPYNGTPIAVTKPISTNYVWITNWNYSFGNVLTNHFYTNRSITIQSIWVTNQIGAPYGSPLVYKTNYTTFKTNLISGDFFIIPTNWCGFEVAATLPDGNPAYAYGLTNTVSYIGYNTNGATGTNLSSSSYGLLQNYYDLYTNHSYAVYPGICEPVVQWGTNYTTNLVTSYQYDFLNVVTNHYYTNSLVSLYITNVYAIPGGSPDQQATNITVTNFYANIPGGDFYIVPTNWCGFQIVSLQTNSVAPNLFLTNQTAGPNNLQYTYVEYVNNTNYVYSLRPGFCEPVVAFATNSTTNFLSTQYQYNFGGGLVINNPLTTNNPVITVTTNIAVLTNGLVGTYTNLTTTTTNYNGIAGDFYVVPPAWCGYTVQATQLVSVVTTTNIFQATNGLGINVGQEQYSQTTTSSYTNAIFLMQPYICSTAPAAPALRQGIEHIQFIRANYDSLLGQYFAPITNRYTMVKITNSQPVTEFYQRVVTQPDFLMSAKDLTTGPDAIPVTFEADRNLNFDSSTVLNSLAGPGTITPATTISFNKSGRTYENFSPAFMYETNATISFLWASFDGSTNVPVVYPNGTSIANLENQILMPVTPATLVNGTFGVAYPPVTFTATGGAPPYTWAAPNVSTSVPGMSFDTSTATLSGTPAAAGTFSFTLQVTDSVNRVVNLNYTLTVP